eukprot:TRINITY_DN8772_c0_g1_i1.p1 TRINITY_DN8772_c0_g1~~TRINITY_DN8772_c0_g1_i1.p1  ORF type:complete len:515 (-),score=115.54 TRINITY_DN8772_c0_g1_i1:150-1574(-)
MGNSLQKDREATASAAALRRPRWRVCFDRACGGSGGAEEEEPRIRRVTNHLAVVDVGVGTTFTAEDEEKAESRETLVLRRGAGEALVPNVAFRKALVPPCATAFSDVRGLTFSSGSSTARSSLPDPAGLSAAASAGRQETPRTIDTPRRQIFCIASNPTTPMKPRRRDEDGCSTGGSTCSIGSETLAERLSGPPSVPFGSRPSWEEQAAQISELEERARRSEYEAERSADEVAKLREWVEDQQLREAQAGLQRLAEYANIRRDIERQFADARRSVVEENAALTQNVEAATCRAEALEERLRDERCCHAERRWQALVLRAIQDQRDVAAEDRWAAARQALTSCRGQVHVRLAGQAAQLRERTREAEALRKENEELQGRLRLSEQELAESLEETRRLESVEEELSVLIEQLSGHANPNQKIKYLTKLRADHNACKSDLRRAQNANLQLRAENAAMRRELGLPSSNGSSAEVLSRRR